MASETRPRKITRAKHGKLRVWWIPQVPMDAFHVEVASLVEAKLILNALAEYDLFHLDQGVKPDYSNAGGLQVYDESECEWLDWCASDGSDIDEYTLEHLRQHEPKLESLTRKAGA